jgi:hypothetical protein
MKKFTFTILTILLLTLTACSTANGVGLASGTQGAAPAGDLPMTTQLILGTFRLEGTENDVSAEQAAELLPLWQTVQILVESDTAAQQETEALTAQIQETMTAEQMQAITDMDLAREDMMSIMQEHGLAMGGGNNNSQSGNSSNNSGGGFGPAGGMSPPDERGPLPGGGPGMGPGGQGSNLSPDQIATAQALRQERSESFIPPMLIEALIEYLHEKAG